MPRWLLPALFALGAVTGAVTWLYSYAVQLHAAACDAPSCPSERTVALGHTLMRISAIVFAVSSGGLIAVLVRNYRRRQRGRPPRRKPTLRDW
jgi:hypothetical protein